MYNKKNKIKTILLENKKNKIFLFSLIFFSIFSYFTYNIEVAKGLTGLDSIIVRMNPEIPNPNQEIKVFLESYSFDINSAETTVYLDGKIIKKDIGLKFFTFLAPDIGKSSELLISSQTLKGKVITGTFLIKPASVNLIYELKNPHRLFEYKGKSTAVSNSELTIYAFPNLVDSSGKKLAKNSLIYTWYKNYEPDLRKSGVGKSTYYIKRLNAHPRVTTISLKVTSLDKTISAEGFLELKPSPVEIEFYILEPTMPFSFQNIANPNIVSRFLDTSIIAVPYFMDTKDNDVEYQWIVNGKIKQTENNSNWDKIILSNSKDRFTKKVKVEFEFLKRYRILQSASKKIEVIFQKEDNEKESIFYEKGSVEEETEGFFGF